MRCACITVTEDYKKKTLPLIVSLEWLCEGKKMEVLVSVMIATHLELSAWTLQYRPEQQAAMEHCNITGSGGLSTGANTTISNQALKLCATSTPTQ